mmetsp:Transcript_14078/g.34342  ORF Transcript_14078/g.34342 Transcript_14078/m.34342 type:complete len:206 (+) Transcript_14078:1722-2339(+)
MPRREFHEINFEFPHGFNHPLDVSRSVDIVVIENCYDVHALRQGNSKVPLCTYRQFLFRAHIGDRLIAFLNPLRQKEVAGLPVRIIHHYKLRWPEGLVQVASVDSFVEVGPTRAGDDNHGNAEFARGGVGWHGRLDGLGGRYEEEEKEGGEEQEAAAERGRRRACGGSGGHQGEQTAPLQQAGAAVVDRFPSAMRARDSEASGGG